MKWILISAVLFVSSAKASFALDVSGVPGFNASRYFGNWFQIASTNPVFQRGCVCSKAKYSPIDFGVVRVENTCFDSQGSKKSIVGKATVVNPEFPAQFSVIFDFFGTGKVNYTVAEIGEDYDYAVVLGENASTVWILARERQIDPQTMQDIKKRLVENNIDISNLTESDTSLCID